MILRMKIWTIIAGLPVGRDPIPALVELCRECGQHGDLNDLREIVFL
jgi:hypothetical protein